MDAIRTIISYKSFSEKKKEYDNIDRKGLKKQQQTE